MKIIVLAVVVLGNYGVLLGIHCTKYYRFNVNFTMLYVDRFVMFQIALAKFSKNLLSLIESRNCGLVTRSALGSVSFS